MAEKKDKSEASSGTLFCSGMIAGEGIVGIVLAILAVIKISGKSLADGIDLSGSLDTGWIGSGVLLLVLTFTVYKAAAKKKAAASSENTESGDDDEQNEE